jgi:hypothetical protein
MATLEWNGSYLGEFSKDAILSTDGHSNNHDNDKYWTLQLGAPVTCRVKTTKTSFPNVIDELKSLFGLPKLGTHQIRINHKNYVLIRCPESGVTEVPLNQFTPELSHYPLFRRQVQEILIFRDILAVPVTFESSLRVRQQPRRHPVPISYREPSMSFNPSKPILSAMLQNRWLNDANVNQILTRMVRIDPEDVSSGISEFRSNVETVISRVDKSLIWCSAFIIERLMSRLFNDSVPPGLALSPPIEVPASTDATDSTESSESAQSPAQLSAQSPAQSLAQSTTQSPGQSTAQSPSPLPNINIPPE